MVNTEKISLSTLLSLLFLLVLVSFNTNGSNSGRHVFKNKKDVAGTSEMRNSNCNNSKIMATSFFKPSASDWIGIPLSKLIGTSELIVYGTVKKVSENTIQFQITAKISGSIKEGTIEILKARPDPFAAVKPAPYQPGQNYLLFLTNSKNSSPKATWKVMGKAEEAQMPVLDNYIYFNDRYLEGIPLERHEVYGVEQSIQRFEFSAFLNAIEQYNQCYKWVKQGQNDTYLPKKLCDDKQINSYAKKSFISNYLVTQTQAFITK